MQAIVYKSTGKWYEVKTPEGQWLKARLKGRLKLDGFTSSNPIAVGDVVELDTAAGEDSLVIKDILPRHNYIIRSSPHNKRQHHIVASNVDQSLLFATIAEPRTSSGFIDRFLVTCEAYHVSAIIVFNKVDLLKTDEEFTLLANWIELYSSIGYHVLPVSMETGQGLDELMALLKDKVTLISGHSGVGKTTFINKLFPDLDLRTQEVSSWSGKGMHTTTFAEMFDLPQGGSIIDTPGIRELGLVDISKEELSHYYPEMRARLDGCKFNNCLHMDERDCAIKQAVATGEIDEERFVNYMKILETIEDKKY